MIGNYLPNLNYWIDIAPPPLEGWKFAVPLALFLILFVGGLIAKVLATTIRDFKLRTILFRVGSLGWVMGIIGGLLIFFEYERVALLRMRILFLVWVLVTLVWLVMVVVRLRKELPSKLERIKEFMEKKKYLPKKK